MNLTDSALVQSNRHGWQANLALRFDHMNGRSMLAARSHDGPLVVQKTLYPEGAKICHAVIVHPPGGIAGGDSLSLKTAMRPAAHALLTTPGAGKWYKANGLTASQSLAFTLAEHAVLEWLPQETIIFDEAEALLTTHVELANDACYAGWEIICLGRQAAGEKFTSGRLRQRTQIFRDELPIWGEFADLRGNDKLLISPVGLNGCTVAATFLIAAGVTPPDVLQACRAIRPQDQAIAGVTALPEIFAARYLGHNAHHARYYFEALWAILRPWYAGQPARRPRIWNT
ncbi:MAG: urease accessory protein UreD [Gallionellaceae bacterium]|nr:urease accessory protein UreD [Gallionellaceae bacterium]